MSLELPPLVRSSIFCFFIAFGGKEAKKLLFCYLFRFYSKVGNSQLQSTRFDYLSFYGILNDDAVYRFPQYLRYLR